MTETKRSTKMISVITILAMVMTIFAIPALTDEGAYAATRANEKNNTYKIPKLVAGKTAKITAAGDRQTALNYGTAEVGDTFYLPMAYAVVNSKGKDVTSGDFINEAVLSDIIAKQKFPANFTSTLKIKKPGKYAMVIGFLRLEWDGISFKTPDLYKDMAYKTQVINVQGTVKFKANTKKVKKLKTKSKTVKVGSKYGKLPKPSKKGYKFVGWYTKKKGGKKVTAKSKVKMTKASQTLYAHWKKK